MSKELNAMTVQELIETERNRPQEHSPSDLAYELTERLKVACDMLDVAVQQCQEYSENELLMVWGPKRRTYQISEVYEFLGKDLKEES